MYTTVYRMTMFFITGSSGGARIKGTVSRDFRLQVFFMNQFPPSIWVYLYGHFEFFRKFAEIFAAQGAPPPTGVNDTGGKWKKSSSRKILIILFGVVELTYIYIFAFKFTLRYPQPNIKLIVCHRCRWHQWQFAAGINDTGGKFATGVVDTGGKQWD